MMLPLRRWLARLWPVMRLRTIMFGLLLLVAALPGVAAIMLRVYENALVRRTEAELIAQGSALAASVALGWPGPHVVAAAAAQTEPPLAYADADSDADSDVGADADERAMSTSIDLRSSPILPERPAAAPARRQADADAARAARFIAPAIAETRHVTLAAIVLLDRHGTILNGRDTGRSLAALPEVRAALAGQAETVLRLNGAYARPYPLEWLSRATALRLHHARPVIAGNRVVGAILLSRSPRALFLGMWEDRGKIAAGTGAIFLFLVLMTAVLGRTIVRPIEALSRATRLLAEGRPAQPPQPSLRVQEIDGLIRDFATMAAAIEARSHYLRDFAAALAHEFKTPLTGLSGGIELLQDHGAGMTEDTRARFLANMAGDADRLNRLISRLMELAKADMTQPTHGPGCDLPGVLARLADGLSSASFAVRCHLPAGLPPLAIDGAALETIITTLIDNARQAGASEMVIGAEQADGAVQISFADNGPGIPAGDCARVFEPFFTSKRAEGGTGLGLPIARALVEASLGSLRHVPSAGGAVFAMTLPVRRPAARQHGQKP